MTLCGCGCGTELADPTRTWAPGHASKMMSDEHRQHLTEARNARDISDEQKVNMSEGQRQSYLDDPTRVARMSESISEAITAKWQDPEYIDHQLASWDNEERREALSDRQSGELHWNWKGGLRPSRECGLGWIAQKELVLARDNHTCQGCGSTDALQVHHIDNDMLNGDERDLITTCHTCNMRAERKDEKEFWFNFYTKKIEEIYSLVEKEPKVG